MLSLLAFGIVLLPLTVCGWFALSLLEGSHPVLLRMERWTLGFLLGTTGGMFLLFLTLLAGASLTRTTILSLEGVLLLLMAGLYFSRRTLVFEQEPLHHERGLLQGWTRIGVWGLGFVSFAKIAFTAATFLLVVQPYLDDTVSNWNLRAKVFFLNHGLTLELPGGDLVNQQLSSYPPTVSLLKASLATIADQFSEPLVNSVHVLWYAAVLILLFSALRRFLPLSWSLLGTYLFVSLPLPLMHGVNAYADMFMAAHATAAVLLLICGLASEGQSQQTFLRLSILMGALLPFTKNEGLLIHFLTFALIWCWSMLSLRSSTDSSQHRRTLLLGIFVCAAIIVPWLLFKWTHGLTFGNAKSVTGLSLSFEPLVLYAFFIHTFYEGNWLLLFPLLLGVLGLRWRSALATPLLPLTVFVGITIVGQVAIYAFTPLATEALRQTGLGRGVLQIVPLCTFLTTILLASILKPETDTQS